MSHEKIIRAWKDESFRNSLSEQERALLPDNPAGAIELSEEVLEAIAGGMRPGGGGGTGGGTGGNCTKCVSSDCGYGTGGGTGGNCTKCSPCG